jgi:amino acid adenylation domain-containing protein
LIEQLSALGVRLSAEGDELRVSAPRGALTSELRTRVAAQKPQLLARLRQPAGRPASSWPAIVPATEERYLPFPLTDIQQAYWVGRSSGMMLGGVGCHGYWEMDALDMDVERLERAWQRLIYRHDMLRVILLPTGEQQVLKETPPFHIETIDLRGRSAAAAAAELGVLRERMSHRLYAPDHWPLFDIHAARLDDRTTRLFLSIDLLVLDGASIFQLMGEARRLYENPTLELPRLDLSFRDYVIAEARLHETDDYKCSERFWLDRATTLPPAPDLPMVHDPTASPHRFVRRLEQIEASVWRQFRARASRPGLTPAGVLCAAWAEALRVWSASPEFTLTVTMFRRLPLHRQVNEIIGDFTTTILLECASHSGGFEARARALQARLADDLDHSIVSGVHIMRERARILGGMQGGGFPVVFTSTLGHQGAADRETSPVAWLGEHIYSVSQTPQVTLDLQVSNYGDGALLVLDAVEALFPAGLLDELFDAYRGLVCRLATDDAAWQESPRHNLSLSAAALETRARVNATAAPISSQLLHELFFEQAAKHAPETAVICPRRRVTYQELLAATKSIGRRLRNEGVRPNSLAAVVMEKGWEQVAAVMGVLASGAAYLPIEPTTPAERLHHLLEHAEVRCVLTQPELDARLNWPASVQRLSIDERSLNAGDSPTLDPVQQPTDLAYVIYTSGSTGLPKGVMIDHRGAVNTVLDINRRFQVGSNDRVLALSSLGFDLSVYDIFGMLAAGGAIVFPEDARRHDPAHWSELVDAEQVTIWNTVPTLMDVWVETREKELPAPLPLRLVLMSGDWIPVTLPERIRALAASGVGRPPCIISLGGATEASIWSILYPIERVDSRWKSIPYGRAMVNQTFHVLDEELKPRPVWTPGMLHIGGIGLAQGYWRDEQKTNASFIVHPRTGERLYRTGDLGRFLPDGNIEFLGRQDGQVKVGGHRIELGEIEANLLRHPAVQQAAVVVRQEQGGGKRLVGFVVPTPGSADPDLDEVLRRHLFSKLPDYMVPSSLVTLASMPVTANAKINRNKLIELAAERARPLSAVAGAAPETTTEQRLCVLVAEVLGKQSIGRSDSFFEVGCTSIELVRLASRVREAFGKNVALAELFRSPTIAALAARLDGHEGPPRPATTTTGESQQTPPPAQHGPASPVQEQLWFAERLRPGRSTYHVHIALRMLGRIDMDALRAAVADITRRHQALRMVFHEVDGHPFWTVRPLEEVALLTVVRAEGFEGESREEEARRRAHASARTTFEVDGGPLSRLELITFASDDALLLLTQHHLVTDGWSVGVLARDLMRAYRARAGGCAPEWAAVPVEYGDLILAEREWLESDSAEQMRAWWGERLAGLRPLELPFRRHGTGTSDAGDSRAFRIGAELASELQTFVAREGTTVFAALFAAFAALLHRYSRMDDFGVGIVTANRPGEDRAETIGFLANTVVMRCDLSDDPSFSTWLARATDIMTETVERQRIPFSELTRLADSREHQGLNPLVEACFAFENVPVPEVELPGLICRPAMETPDAGVRETAKFDLVLVVAPAREGFAAEFQYATELFDGPMIERVIANFTALLEAAVQRPGASLSQLPLLTPSERRQVLVDWNANSETEAPQSTVADLVEAQAARTPDAPALVCGDHAWNYAVLNQRANRLARHLRALGVEPEARVVLCARRGPELVAAMLAVLKAGAAYVPIDPAYPTDRRAFILEDSGASVVIGHQALLADLPTAALPVIDLEQSWLETGGGEPRALCSADSLAYVIYTSGSTGRPKGVGNTRRGLMNLVRWHQRTFGITAVDRATQIAAVGFDAAVWEIWPYLTAGASVHMPSDAVREDPEALRDWLIGNGITVSFVPTPLAEEMLELAWPRNTPLRFLLTGADRLRRRPPVDLPFALINNYGPSECAVVATSGVVRHESSPDRLPTIGRPIDGARVYVLDDCMEPVPPGCEGEVYVGGAGVGRGYIGRADLTAERFVPDPFSDEAGSRLYRTGDLVRWTEGGELEFLGRADDQVKVRGFRIELGEIEAVLSAHAAVMASVVVAREDTPGEKRLAAYVVVREGQEVSREELRAHLKAQLPDYMVPAAMVFLGRLPLTAHGKVNRAALPAPETLEAPQSGALPRTPLEEILASIWAEVLKCDRVGIDQDFFELGGHSLLVPRLFSMIEKRLGRRLPLGVLYRSPTIEAMAKTFSLEASRSSVLVPFMPVGDGPKFFCVHPAGGAVIIYKALADCLRPLVRMYGLQSPGVMDDEQPLRSIEAMARRYVLELRAEQPHGPYHIGGYSLGGGVAFEMAAILMREGEEVATLALMDSAPPGVVRTRALDPRVVTLLARVIGVPMTENDVPELPYDETVTYVARRIARKTVAFGTEEEIAALLYSLLRLEDIMRQAWQRYQPHFYPGALVFLKAAEGLGINTDQSNRNWADGWSPLVADLTLAEVPGTHETIVLEPKVHELAKALSDYVLSGWRRMQVEPNGLELKKGERV